MKQAARIVGPVDYREGDGTRLPIPPGPIEIETTDHDVTIAWADGEHRGSAAMPLTDFERFVASRAIVVGEASGRPN